MNIEKQIELEQSMIDAGADAYLRSQRKAEQQGRASELDYSRRLMQEFVTPLCEALQAWLGTGGARLHGKARNLIRLVNPEKAIFIAMKCMFNDFTRETPTIATAQRIGRMIEDEIRFTRFQDIHGAYYDKIIQDFRRKGTKDYRYMQRVLTHQANELEQEWTTWTVDEKVLVGTALLNIIITNTDLAERKDRRYRNKTLVEIIPTKAALDFIREHEHVKQFMYPERNPCVIPPDPWTSINQGGYYTPRLRSNVPMVKTIIKKARREAHDWSIVMDSLNKAQATAWRVNERVLEIAQEVWHRNLQIGMPGNEELKPSPCPVDGIPKDQMTEQQLAILQEWKHEASAVYTMEKERVSRGFGVSRVLRMAADYRQYPAFWYVWYCDFRGRLYTATAGFSPQGTDLAKGLLCFHEGLANGPRGAYWLKVHGANRFGYDKEDYDARVRWIDSQHHALMAVANDPLGNREVWSGADKPWQYLAFIFEYARMHQEIALGVSTEETFVSYLPVGLDGSCNGLQNFSAMLRDEVGGAATNLTIATKPSDIYARVCEVAVRKVQERLDAALALSDVLSDDARAARDTDLYYAQKWLQYGLTRKDTKRPVMTLPYGSTRQSCTKYIFLRIVEVNKEHFGKGKAFSAAVWLTPLVWEAIGEVVVAATKAMKWLQQCATAMNKIDEPIYWKTADNFLAIQSTFEIETKRIETQLAGRLQYRAGIITQNLDKNGQRNGISPNFVHSQDATHLRMTVRVAWERGIRSMALIHDDYGTHPGNTELLHEIIRETFVTLYRDNDPLEKFSDYCMMQGADVPPLPKRGTLDLTDVLRSPFFFG